MNWKERPDSILGAAFWSAALVPIAAVILGYLVTPVRHYAGDFGGFLVPLGVYGLLGFVAGVPTFLTALLLLFPLRLGSLTFASRFIIVVVISSCTCAVSVCVGLTLMLRYESHLVL